MRNSALAFIFGAVSGSVVAWFTCKAICERKAAEDAEEIRSYYISKYEGIDIEKNPEGESSENKAKQNLSKPNLMDFYKAKENAQTARTEYSKAFEPSEGLEESEEDAEVFSDHSTDEILTERYPVSISPAQFASLDNYEKVTLTYYADGVLYCEDDDEILPIDRIGSDNLDKFGEFEEDVLYVRNDLMGTDYEVIADPETYQAIHGPFEED